MFEHEADRLFLFRDKWASEYAVSCLHWTFITRAGCIMTPTLSWMITDSRYLVVWCNLTDNAMWRRQQWTALTALWPLDTRDLRSHRVWVSPEPAISCQQPSHVDTRRVSISSRCWPHQATALIPGTRITPTHLTLDIFREIVHTQKQN